MGFSYKLIPSEKTQVCSPLYLQINVILYSFLYWLCFLKKYLIFFVWLKPRLDFRSLSFRIEGLKKVHQQRAQQAELNFSKFFIKFEPKKYLKDFSFIQNEIHVIRLFFPASIGKKRGQRMASPLTLSFNSFTQL